MGRSRAGVGDWAVSSIRARQREAMKALLRGHVKVVCRDKDGNIKWIDESENIIVNTGLDYVIDVAYGGSGEATQTHPWHIGLTDGTPSVVAGDTMASHAGWVEVEDYTEGTREEMIDVNVSTGTRDNSASVATFTINTTVTVGGIFMASSNTKGESASILNSGVAFSGGDRALVNLDSLEVTYTLAAADA